MELASAPVGIVNTLSRKCWTAYFGVAATALLFFIVLLVFNAISTVFSLLMSLVFIAYLTNEVLAIRSLHLYYDEVGVWVYSGAFPWNRGITGVKWRDLDEATFAQGMRSWLFKSYSIRVGHRFTKSSELFLTNMAEGNEAVMKINALHRDLVKGNRLA